MGFFSNLKKAVKEGAEVIGDEVAEEALLAQEALSAHAKRRVRRMRSVARNRVCYVIRANLTALETVLLQTVDKKHEMAVRNAIQAAYEEIIDNLFGADDARN